jgi:hypothetical protein
MSLAKVLSVTKEIEMKKFITVLALCVATTAFASTKQTSVDVSKLTPEQIAQINSQVSEMTKDPVNVSATVRKEAEAWGELGANMGKAMVGAAREVGVASNEFANTSLGKVVVGIVAYKVVGKDILGVIFGSLILAIGYSLAIWVLTTRRWSVVTYEYDPVFWGMFKKQRILSTRTDTDVITGKILSAGALALFTTIVGLKTIF